MYKILFTANVFKELENLDNFNYLKISERILLLENEPRPVGSLKLTNSSDYRIRFGNYRTLYHIEDENCIVKILKIAHRKDVYKKKK